MGEVCEFRSWDELIPDALGVIFTNLSLQERVTVIPRVCKSWARAVSGPYCWQEIDIEEWSNHCQPDKLDQMLHMLINKSCGSLRKLCVSGLQSESIFTFIAENAGSLRSLRLPRSNMSDLVVEQIAGKFSMITFLDVSYCIKIGASAIEMIGMNCKMLEGLCRNMHPLDTADKPLQDDEAYAIAATMPKLKHLEMAYQRISTLGVVRIFSSCPKLEFLDLRGCWSVNLDNNVSAKQGFPKLRVLGPYVLGAYEIDDWDDDYSDVSDDFAWNFEDGNDYYVDYDSDGYEGRIEDELEFGFYEGIEDAAMYWPPSP
ncbi:F-box protein FBW2 [Vicia villosa]|uniref:F-box protein FBW2 n=1 Tax=Vicia villosa TaxID=3911 RepID=UPI00273BDDC2|nr:F-box protein FBW2 [Vicia villosa]XP_058781958.1 F-box protein FBW2 [Vicia villosa]